MTATTIRVQMAQRKDTAANWTAANPILLSGEIGYETDTKKFKIGNGSTNWNSLAYLPIPDGSGNLTITGNLEIGSTGSLTFEGSTADGFETTLAVTNPTADRTITLPNQSGTVLLSGNASIVDADISATAEIAVSKLADGTARQLLQTDAAGTGVEWASNIDIPGTLDVTGAATFDAAVTVTGDLTVNGTTTTISTQNLLVEDKNIIIGDVATPTDVTADGGGITLKGTTDKTINWIDSTDSWTSSEHVDIASGKSYRINGAEVLSSSTLGSGVTGSSLTSVGSIGTGVWQGTAISKTYLDATLVSTGDTGTVTSAMIANGTIVDADLNASAAIAGTKISPDFGSQNAITTGTSTAASFIPTSSTVPTNGVYLPAANSVAISTAGSGRLFVDASGRVGVGVAPSAPLEVNGEVRFTRSGVAGQYVGVIADGTDTRIFAEGSSKILSIKNNSTTSSAILFDQAVASSYIFNQAGNERMRLDSSGRLGVGTSSVDSLLHVESASIPTITLEQTGYKAEFRAAGNDLEIRCDEGNTGGQLEFYVGGGTTGTGQKMTILPSGRVGIGTTSPADKLHVDGGSIRITGTNPQYVQAVGINLNLNTDNQNIIFSRNASEMARFDSSSRLLVGTSSSSQATRLVLQGNSASGTDSTVAIFAAGTATPSNGQVLGYLRFSDSGHVSAADIVAARDGGTWTSGSSQPSRLVFSSTRDGQASPTEACRIDSSQRLLVGTTTPRGRITSEPAAGDWGLGVNDVNAGTQSFAAFRYSGTLIGSITGNNTATAYNTSSDYRLKENVSPAIDGITRLQQLKPSRFNFIADPGHTVDGFIAHEAQAVVPECVTGEKDAVDDDGNPVYQGIDQSKLVPLLTAALQEAVAKIESLEARLTAAGI